MRGKKLIEHLNSDGMRLLGAVMWAHYNGAEREEAQQVAERLAEELNLKNANDLIEDALVKYYGEES